VGLIAASSIPGLWGAYPELNAAETVATGTLTQGNACGTPIGLDKVSSEWLGWQL